MPKKNLFDTIESVLKNEKFDDHQRKAILYSLSNCKYSKLKYNQIELNEQKFKPLERSVIETKTATYEKILEDGETSSSGDSSFSPQTDRINKIIKDTSENEQEIENIIHSSNDKNVLSPSSFYLKFQGLSVDDQSYLEAQDNDRLQKFKTISQKVKKRFVEPDKFIKNLNKLKEGQEELRVPFFIKIKAKETSQSTVIDKRISSTKDHDDLGKNIEFESRLSNLINSVKELKQKCDTHEHREEFDLSFHENLTKSLELIEQFKSKPSLEETYVKQMEDELLTITRAYEQKMIDISLKIKERRERLELEKSEQNKTNFQNEVKAYKSKFDNLAKFLMHLITNLDLKIQEIKALKNPNDFLNQAKNLFDAIESNIKEIHAIIDFNFMKSVENETIFNKVLSDLNLNLLKYTKNKELFESKLEDLNQSVKTALDLHRIATLKEKETIEAAQRLKEAQEAAALKQKQKEDEEKAAARVIQENRVAARNKLVQNIHDSDKNGINQEKQKSYEILMKSFDKIRSDAETALSSSSYKSHKFDLQKSINFPLNSLLEDNTNEENRRNFDEKIKTLLRLLSGQTVNITTSLRVAPSTHPKSIEFCLVYLARKLVEKGEETVATRPETAFQYVQVILKVIKQVKEFESILIAQFHEKCPLTVPYYKPRLPGQTDDQYYEYLGYKLINGKVEEDVHYYKRMSGVLNLYFTLLMALDTRNSTIDGMKTSWFWISDVLNLTPRPEITAEMLTIFFKCCGYHLKRAYRNQFLKLVKICFEDFMQLIKSIPNEKQSVASVGRLQSIFDSFSKTREFIEWKKN